MSTQVRRPTVAGIAAAALTVVALLLVPAAPAAAHNALKAATPAKDARLTEPPKQITLEFLQKLNPAFTTITLSDATLQKVPTSEPTVDGGEGTITVDQALPNGTYTVAYRVVSADGHPVQGSYRFTVADPTASGSPEAAAAPATSDPAAEASTTPASPAPAAGATGDGPGVMLLVGGGILLAVIIGAGAVALRRRRSTRAS
ncbi:copper resistance protein CopC [Micromonospora sp. WMMA1363]|uniref:copper resistance CopC family protein n=1 Tax=Micromonospora sp. WMMA1363 TaxID=3053985 RepID=UPI00259C78AF|nr:copper resistance CopC family protein [Micromonospora sp. WMMA1363]MDM4719525.1 copper resistance protein CopC [Micromonospora sp. WMMA1363]